MLQACGSPAPGYILPGLDACLRLSAAVEVEAASRFASPAYALSGKRARSARSVTQASHPTSIDARARLQADVRTQTEYGPLRVYVSVRAPTPLSAAGPSAGILEPR